MPQIVKLVRDDAWDVQDEFVDFLSSLAGEGPITSVFIQCLDI